MRHHCTSQKHTQTWRATIRFRSNDTCACTWQSAPPRPPPGVQHCVKYDKPHAKQWSSVPLKFNLAAASECGARVVAARPVGPRQTVAREGVPPCTQAGHAMGVGTDRDTRAEPISAFFLAPWGPHAAPHAAPMSPLFLFSLFYSQCK